MSKTPRILLTGATGFVGRSVAIEMAKYFNKKDILCLGWLGDDKINHKNKEMLERKGFSVELVDLITKKNFDKIPQKIKIVVHMAANVNTADPDHRINDIGTRNLINHLRLNSNSHFIHTSTTVHTVGHLDCRGGINENTPSIPTNEYGRTKLNAEKILIKKCRKDNFRLTIARLNTVYGPDPRPNSMFLQLPDMIKRGSLFTKMNWPGKTALVHVKDVAYVVSRFATNITPPKGKPVVYIVFSENIQMREIVKLMHKQLKVPYKPLHMPRAFWNIAKYLRRFVPRFEGILPTSLYGSIWRASLIVDDVVYCTSGKLEEKIPDWRKKRLKETISSIF